jgi:DNA (cytosine-5)-methyltransferase 1
LTIAALFVDGGLRELGLFAGAGGGLLASRLLGWRTVCAVEIEPYCQSVLRQRQHDGHLEPFPIWDDIRTFDGRPWHGSVDVVSGGFPCQDISSAGKGAGLAGDRSGLWFEMLRVIGEVRPAYVFAENSPNLRTRGLDVVLSGLAGLGYDAAWGVLGAWHVGAPHRRNRMWIVAAHPDRCRERELPEHAEMAGAQGAECDATDANGLRSGLTARQPSNVERRGTGSICRHAANTDGAAVRQQPGRSGGQSGPEAREPGDTGWWSVHRFAGVDDGLADRVERVRATGNGQVPAVAALAWRVLSGVLG